MSKKNLFGMLTIVLVVFLSSCGKSPVAEIESANAAIEKATTAEAMVYAPQEFAALQDSMNVAMVLVEEQNAKKMKKFGAAKEKLQEVVSLADSVIVKAAANKEQMKADIQTLLAEVKTLQDENNQLITQVPKGKEGTAAIEEIKSEIAAISTSVTEANAQLEKGEIVATLEDVKAAKDQATSLNTELKDVLAKVGKKTN
ncbi:MAG: hypothetical protein JXB49_18065 [Bacteroidales bacterium]|nr:hypothetical protein [Bacteroidales bacterium]